MRRSAFTIASALSMLLCVGAIAMWVRSEYVGDYVWLGPAYLSFARGDCRLVCEPFGYEPPWGSGWHGSRPLSSVGDYPLGSHAVYIPLWLPVLTFLALGAWTYWTSRRLTRPGVCAVACYDLCASEDPVKLDYASRDQRGSLLTPLAKRLLIYLAAIILIGLVATFLAL